LVSEAGEAIGEVNWIDDGSTRVVVSTKSDLQSQLNLNDQIYPGWRVTVDGNQAVIIRQTNEPIFRAVSVPAGKHVVAFVYDPASFRLGLFLAIMGWSAIVGMFVFDVAEGTVRKQSRLNVGQ